MAASHPPHPSLHHPLAGWPCQRCCQGEDTTVPHLAVPHDAPNLWRPWKHVWPPSKLVSSTTFAVEVDPTLHPWQEAVGEDEDGHTVAQEGAAVGTTTGVVDPRPR